MNDISYRFTLDINDAASQVTLAVKRTERGRILRIAFCASGEPVELPDGCYAVFNARRAADGAVFCGDTVVYRDAVQVSLDAVIGTVCGRIDCDISVYTADGATVLSPSFRIVVYSSALGNDEIEGTDEFRTLGELVAEAEELCSDAASLQSKSEELNAETEALQRESSEVASEVRAALSSGVRSFCGRVGAVLPQAGDYSAYDVGAAPEAHNHQASEIQGLATWLDDNGYAGGGSVSGTYSGDYSGILSVEIIENTPPGGVMYRSELVSDNPRVIDIGGTFGTLEIVNNGTLYTLSAGESVCGYLYAAGGSTNTYSEFDAWAGPWPVITFTGSEIHVYTALELYYIYPTGFANEYHYNNLPYSSQSTSSSRVQMFNAYGVVYSWRAY